MTATKGTKFGGRKVREGTVVSDKMQKTVLVAVEEHVKHRLYKKRVKRVHKFMAHDETGSAHLGDRVRIVESRPVSKLKRWALVEVLQRVDLPEVSPESIDLDLLGEVKPVATESEAAVEVATPAAKVEEPAATETAAEIEAAPEPEVVAAVPEEIVVEETAETEAMPETEPEPAAAEPVAEAESEPVAEETAVEEAVAAEPISEAEPVAETEASVEEAPAAETPVAEEAPADAAEASEPEASAEAAEEEKK